MSSEFDTSGIARGLSEELSRGQWALLAAQTSLTTKMSGGLGLLGTLKRKVMESKAEVEKWKKTVEEASWKTKVGKNET